MILDQLVERTILQSVVMEDGHIRPPLPRALIMQTRSHEVSRRSPQKTLMVRVISAISIAAAFVETISQLCFFPKI
jgi:hypothetical protein